MRDFIRRSHVKAFLAVAVTCCLGLANVEAAPITYGDFAGSTVMYLDVTENTNSGDTLPLFGAPTVAGDVLDFNPSGFSASSAGGSPDITDGQLNFTMMGSAGNAITSCGFRNGAITLCSVLGRPRLRLGMVLRLPRSRVLEIDGVAVSPISLASSSDSDSKDLINDSGIADPWSLAVPYNVNARLTNRGISYLAGATKIKVALDNTLLAISEPTSIAFIAKKDFKVRVRTAVIPEPSSLVLLSVVACGAGVIRRRRR